MRDDLSLKSRLKETKHLKRKIIIVLIFALIYQQVAFNVKRFVLKINVATFYVKAEFSTLESGVDGI